MPLAWREHPKLIGRFHPEFPDDLQVVVHEGGPHMSEHAPELVWVRVNAYQEDVFYGEVVNQPAQLREVAQGSQILFIVPSKGQDPLQVTHKYLLERPTWRILGPCSKCGLTEIFDPPSELLGRSFSHLTADQLERGFTFTTAVGAEEPR